MGQEGRESKRRSSRQWEETGASQKGKLLFPSLTAGWACMLCLATYLDQPNPELAISMSYTNHRHIVWKKHYENKLSDCKAPTRAHPAWRTRVHYRSTIRVDLPSKTLLELSLRDDVTQQTDGNFRCS